MNTRSWSSNHPWSRALQRGVGWYVVVAALTFSSLVTLLATGFTLYQEYRREVQLQQEQLQQIGNSFKESLATALWNIDSQTAQQQLEGIERFPAVVFAQLLNQEGSSLAQAGHAPSRRAIELRTPVHYRSWSADVLVGELVLYSDKREIIGRMGERIWTVLWTQAIKTFLVSAFLLLAFQQLVGRHLRRLMSWAESIGAGNWTAPLKLRRKTGGKKDEFDAITEAFKAMQTQLGSSHARLEASERRANTIVEQLIDGVIQIDTHGKMERVNIAACRIFGYDEQELLGQNVHMLMAAPERGAHDGHVQAHANGGAAAIIGVSRQVQGIRKSGEPFPMDLAVSAVDLDDRRIYIGLVRDQSERLATKQQLWRQANLDPLTGLANRTRLLDQLEKCRESAQHNGLPLALLVIDIDRFKLVNDSMGHGAGDEVLSITSQRLQALLRPGDTLARLGGDEFAILLPDLVQLRRVEQLAASICDALTMPYDVAGQTMQLSASTGIALYPIDANADTRAVLRCADQAMCAARALGGNRYQFFRPAMQEAAATRLALVNDLAVALAQRQFTLHYQPIVNLGSGEVLKAEALVRWSHPTRGFVSPAQFIPVAEEIGLIHELGHWVFCEAAGSLQALRSVVPWFKVSVNTSPVQYQGESPLLQQWLSYLQMLGLPADSVVIEITEGLLMDDHDVAQAQLKRFRDAGIQVSIDDFGTGYSSLAYLKKFNIDYIKIDQSFVRNIAPGNSDHALCEAIIAMAHRLGLQVVAEGIETQAQFDLLREAGCDLGQGYHIARPMPIEALIAWLRARELTADPVTVTA